VIAIVDYGMGNRRSVEKAVEHVGGRALITRDPEQIRAAAGVILPGVGAFPEAMRRLEELGLIGVLREVAAAGTPLLGICLGMQLLFDSTTEHGGAIGLGLLPGDVTYLDTHGERLPHIGWNLVKFRRAGRLTAGLDGGAAFYHVHSLACRPAEAGDVVGTASYGEDFSSIVERGNVFGAQFHPEKSSRDGLSLLGNFVGLAA
jgi:imidazole glycerol-phosphate synthase subunit HisH